MNRTEARVAVRFKAAITGIVAADPRMQPPSIAERVVRRFKDHQLETRPVAHLLGPRDDDDAMTTDVPPGTK